MNFRLFILLGLMLVSSCVSKTKLDLMTQDWANLERYQAANEKIMDSSEEVKVVFMGNSITEFWVEEDPEFFSKNSFVGRGISGQTTPQMLLRFRQDVIDLKPETVVILAGTNDIAQNTGPITLEQILENIQSMSELARAHQINVVLCSVLPASDFPWTPNKNPWEKIPALNQMIQAYAGAHYINYVDYFSAMVDDENGLKKSLGDDGVHPNKAGYEVMKSEVMRMLNI